MLTNTHGGRKIHGTLIHPRTCKERTITEELVCTTVHFSSLDDKLRWKTKPCGTYKTTMMPWRIKAVTEKGTGIKLSV